MKEKDILKKVRLLGDRVLIREDESLSEKKTSQGIIIPVTVSNDKGSQRGHRHGSGRSIRVLLG
jgi:co-chaperonin GroES (HSP10)